LWRGERKKKTGEGLSKTMGTNPKTVIERQRGKKKGSKGNRRFSVSSEKRGNTTARIDYHRHKNLRGGLKELKGANTVLCGASQKNKERPRLDCGKNNGAAFQIPRRKEKENESAPEVAIGNCNAA